MSETKRIGIMTSGGDCAGLNAAIRAVVHHAVHGHGWQVIGIREGTQGLMDRPVNAEEITVKSMLGRGLIRTGGTFLGTTTKGDPLAYLMPDGSIIDRSEEVAGGYRELGLDALIVIGGDGSMRILREIARRTGMNIVGIPKTIDNDVGSTDSSIGFATAYGVATDALDRLHSTAASHKRVMILETMGRDAGHIALSAGIAGDADIILIPEIGYRLAGIIDKIESRRRDGKDYSLIVTAEGVKTETEEPVTYIDSLGHKHYGGVGQYLAHSISDAVGADCRVTTLGHVQRGGMPSARDRLIASSFGVYAVDLVAEGKFDRMVCWSDRLVTDVALAEAVSHNTAVDPGGTLVRTALGLGIYLGDISPAATS